MNLGMLDHSDAQEILDYLKDSDNDVTSEDRDLYIYLILINKRDDLYDMLWEFFEEKVPSLPNDEERLKISELPEHFSELK